ncbi:hypothetical protein AB0G04_34620 [Actinoplanes sp. NPDC023801]|uniref:hypothetical protein n=1 Tax=Actinoplanes sp. NPDC023801 TaxID=3154595 RepID=UPI0033D6A778
MTERRRARQFREVDLAVTEALTTAENVREAGPRVLAAICAAFGWPYAEIWLVDQDAGTLVLAARHHTGEPGTGDPHTGFGSCDTVTGTAWRTGRPAWAGEQHVAAPIRLAGGGRR